MVTRLRTILLAGLVLALFSSAFGRDWHLRLNVPLVTQITDTLPLAPLGNALYDAQEGVHAAVAGSTGIALDYFYIWIHVGELSIPVDPIYFSK